jgi:hypothetical protein
MNVYPGARIDHSEDHVSVYGDDGLILAVKRGGGGQLVDMSEALGGSGKYDLSPIPKNARVYKLTADNKIAKDEKAAERLPVAKELVKKFGKVPCIASLKKDGYQFDGDSVALEAEKVLEG